MLGELERKWVWKVSGAKRETKIQNFSPSHVKKSFMNDSLIMNMLQTSYKIIYDLNGLNNYWEKYNKAWKREIKQDLKVRRKELFKSLKNI